MTKNQFKKFCTIAEKLSKKCSSNFKFKVVAIIFKKNKIISTGVNSNTKSYPFLKRHFVYATLHAEIAAIIPILHYDNIDTLDIFVYRVTREGNIGNAKPCPMCSRVLFENGRFKNVYWTTEDGGWDEAKIDDLHSEVMKIDYRIRYFFNGNKSKFMREWTQDMLR